MPDFIDATEANVDYHACEFSLAPRQKAELAHKLQPYLGKDVEQVDMEKLKNIVADALPPSVLPQLRRTLSRKEDAPVIIHNLPEVEWSNSFADRVSASRKDAMKHSMSFWIMQGIFLLAECDIQKQIMLTRDTHRKLYRESYKIHRDNNPVSALSAIHNSAHAETHFVNMESVLKELPDEVRNRLYIEPITALGVQTAMTLNQLKSNLSNFRYRGDVAHGIQLDQGHEHHPDDVKLFESAIEKHTLNVDIQPGTLVIWDTAYHRAREGKVKAIDPTGYDRAVIFGGAVQRDSGNLAVC